MAMSDDDHSIYVSDEKEPIDVPHRRTMHDIFASVTRAFVSLALLIVMLLAFGAAIAAWAKRGELETQWRDERSQTSQEARLVVNYRDALAATNAKMANEQSVEAAPAAPAWQRGIDALRRQNNDLRWANEQLRAQTQTRRNRPSPDFNRMP